MAARRFKCVPQRLDEVVVWRAERRGALGAARREGLRGACLVEGTAGGLSPPADATCGKANGSEYEKQPHLGCWSQPSRRNVAEGKRGKERRHR